MPQPWEKYQQSAPIGNSTPWVKYGGNPTPVENTTTAQEYGATPLGKYIEPVLEGGANILLGAGKGVLNTVSSADDFARAHLPAFFTNSNFGFGKPADLNRIHAATVPQNTTQKIGKAAEQVGEFFVPGPLEEAAISRLGGSAVARLATKATGAGAVNKLQGGSFAGGAIAGGVGEGLTQGIKAIAPAIAETALRVRGADRGYGATPGRAVLDETSGLTLGKVAQQAQDRIGQLTEQKQALAAVSPNSVTLTAPRATAKSAYAEALSRNNASTIKDAEKLGDQLHVEYGTGTPEQRVTTWDGRKLTVPAIPPTKIPEIVTPTRAIDLQRGVADLRDFSPTARATFSDAAAGKAYHELGDAINQAVPEIAPLNDLTSSLIPVAKRAATSDLNAGVTQRLLARVGAHTGALAGAGIGSGIGYERGGTGGAIVGGLAGFALPELISSPEVQLTAARIANGSKLGKIASPAIRSAALQFFRPSGGEQ